MKSSFITRHSSLVTLAKRAGVFAAVTAAVAGCRKSDMSSQPKFYHPYSQTAQFADGTTARPIPAGTVARGHLALSTDLYTGLEPGPEGRPYPINYLPVKMTKDDLERGQEKFNIYCAVCHGKVGDGAGMVVARGMIRPPSLVWVDRPMTGREINVQRAPIGHYFDVITNGYGAMYSYNDKLSVEDRWRVAAYVKALQVSQDADLKYVTFEQPKPTTAAPVPQQTDPHKPYAGHDAPPMVDTPDPDMVPTTAPSTGPTATGPTATGKAGSGPATTSPTGSPTAAGR